MTSTLKQVFAQQFNTLADRVRVANRPGDLDGLLACHILAQESVKGLDWHVSCALGDWVVENEGQIKQGNFPMLASIGYSLPLEQGAKVTELADLFIKGFQRLQPRELFPADRLSFPLSPKAFLGIALGAKHIPDDTMRASAVHWLSDVFRQTLKRKQPSPLGFLYFYIKYVLGEECETVHDISWIKSLTESSFYMWATQRQIVRLGNPEVQLPQLQEQVLALLPKTQAEMLDAPEAALVLSAANTCIRRSVHEMILSSSHVTAILNRFEDGMKRWPERWAIKDEKDVQNMVWLILRSYVDDLVDEDTLPRFGHSSYTADFGIPSLGLLIEIKMVRKAQEFKKVEKEIMEDAIGYLQDTKRYSKLLVFIYDQSSSVQEHGTTRLALKKIPQIEEVVIVSRPSQLMSSL